MQSGPKPRFPSSIAIKTPEDGRRAIDDLKRRGADFIKLQSLIPREAVFAIADEATILCYLRDNLHFELGDRDLQGIDTFKRYCVRYNLIPGNLAARVGAAV